MTFTECIPILAIPCSSSVFISCMLSIPIMSPLIGE
jgi:hypothetical protein